ncbi:hypothetical protein JCM11641_001276 [Rhodosporidiobolus odoratus]
MFEGVMIGNEMADEMAKRASEDASVAAAAEGIKVMGRKRLVMPREAIERSLGSSDDEGSEYVESEASGVIATRLASGTSSFSTTPVTDHEGSVSGGDQMPKSVTAVLQGAKAALKQQWADEWAASKVGTALRSVDTSPPSSPLRRFIRSLSRPHATLLTRLRTDFSHLAHPLHRSKLHPTGLCECGDQETREHFFLHCPLYSSQRSTLLSSLPTRHLPPLSSLLSSEAFLPAVLTYISSTDRFPRLYSPVTENGGGAAKR